MSPLPPDNKRVFLTGFMGAGKSTIGKILAAQVGYRFYDTDFLVVKGFGKPVSRIFREHGEPAFRDAEFQVLKELARRERVIVSTGGGTLAREECMSVALAHGRVVYLRAPVEDLYERVIFSPKDRPILDAADTETVFRELFESRQVFYERAHHALDTAGRNPKVVVGEIRQMLGLPEAPRREPE